MSETPKLIRRPALPPGERRDHVARVPMSEAELAAAERVRERLGHRSMAAMVRALIAREDQR